MLMPNSEQMGLFLGDVFTFITFQAWKSSTEQISVCFCNSIFYAYANIYFGS